MSRRLSVLMIAFCCLPAFPQAIRFENGIFHVDADATNTRYDNLLDIEAGTSITFIRKNATTFSVSKGMLAYDEDVGPLFHEFRSSDGAD